MHDAPGEAAVLLGRLATDLAAGAPLVHGLALLIDGFGLRSAAVRCAGSGELLARAGDVLHVVPGQRGATARDTSLTVSGSGAGERAVLVVSGARPSQLPALRAAAAVLGLALAAPAVPAPSVGVGLDEADEDAHALADQLHDGPVQTLVAARYACDAAVRGGDPVQARDAVQAALVDLRRTLWHLRPRGPQGLPGALAALSERLVEAGGPPVELDVDAAAADRLPSASRSAVFRLVQGVTDRAPGAVRLTVHDRGDDVVVVMDAGTERSLDGLGLGRLRALGGELSTSGGRLRLVLPAARAADAHVAAPQLAVPHAVVPGPHVAGAHVVAGPDVVPLSHVVPVPHVALLPGRAAAGPAEPVPHRTPEEACS